MSDDAGREDRLSSVGGFRPSDPNAAAMPRCAADWQCVRAHARSTPKSFDHPATTLHTLVCFSQHIACHRVHETALQADRNPNEINQMGRVIDKARLPVSLPQARGPRREVVRTK